MSFFRRFFEISQTSFEKQAHHVQHLFNGLLYNWTQCIFNIFKSCHGSTIQSAGHNDFNYWKFDNRCKLYKFILIIFKKMSIHHILVSLLAGYNVWISSIWRCNHQIQAATKLSLLLEYLNWRAFNMWPIFFFFLRL